MGIYVDFFGGLVYFFFASLFGHGRRSASSSSTISYSRCCFYVFSFKRSYSKKNFFIQTLIRKKNPSRSGFQVDWERNEVYRTLLLQTQSKHGEWGPKTCKCGKKWTTKHRHNIVKYARKTYRM